MRVKSRLQQAAPYRLLTWAKAASRGNVRFPRLMAATVEQLVRSQLASRFTSWDARALTGIRRRWRRLNKRAVLDFYKKGCGKCRACAVKRPCRRSKRVFVRQGRRGYAGLFGKRR